MEQKSYLEQTPSRVNPTNCRMGKPFVVTATSSRERIATRKQRKKNPIFILPKINISLKFFLLTSHAIENEHSKRNQPSG